MSRSSWQRRAIRLGLVASYVLASILIGRAAESSFRLERVDGSRPREGIGITRVVASPSFYAAPAPVPSRSAVQDRISYPEPRGHVSVNHRVRTQGCEAAHAQEVSPNGLYWGWYQFDRGTWAEFGGDPSAYGSAPTAEQDRVAARVNSDRWPNC
jgi:hypothetical protein